MVVEVNTSRTMEKTYAMIKPDAVSAGASENILQEIELAGFSVITKSRVKLTPQRAAEFYAEHKGKHFYENLVSFMSSGPVIGLVLAKENAISEWRSLMGPTNSQIAREQKPSCLRAKYGTDGTQNACHGSDSVTSAAREIRFFFPHLILDPLPDPSAAKKYIMKELQPTLVQGLTALCKGKPSADKMEAITWLAHWLLDNNPNKPRKVKKEELELRPEDEEDDVNFGKKMSETGDRTVEEMEEDLAATKVQAHFRGYVSRKNQAKARKEGPKVVVQAHEMTEEDLAATKVQASFRGHQDRKKVKGMKK
mmetsp:Transcript_20330/g.24353  ORF Transcript_20330/g.24353 Transcript_20330/m.24353 type:complete len:309 (+) Transcript_20330:55-981(+)